jgi:P27 family predicted phage terminase small subunit
MPIERKAILAKGDGRTPSGVAIPDGMKLPIVRNEIPDCDVTLSPRGEQRWAELWTAGWWLKPEMDYPWVERICQAYDEIEVYRRAIRETGLLVAGSMGQQTANPLIAEVRRLEAGIRKDLSEIGFSPTARARLNLVETQAASKLQDMIAKANKGT